MNTEELLSTDSQAVDEVAKALPIHATGRETNPSAVDAAVTVVLHGENGHSLSDTIPGSSQAVFENVVGLLGVTGKGALEIRSGESRGHCSSKRTGVAYRS